MFGLIVLEIKKIFFIINYDLQTKIFMDSFCDTIRKSFAQKSFWKRMIWTVWIKAVQDFFGDKNIEWFIRFNTLYIKTPNQNIKIQAFQKKKEILEKVNLELKNLWYKRVISEIRF